MGRLRSRSRRPDARTELVLGLGFVMVAAAVLLARASPATGYERSIYESTPRLVWGLLGGALLIALGVAVYRESDRLVAIALALGGTATTVISALPIVRGYHFFGAADSLTHLGWTRDIASGAVDPHSLFYPAYHSLSLGLGRLLGLPLEHALLVAMVVLFVPFLLFVPLTVRVMTGDTRATAIAGVASWMVLPVNNVATHLIPHTNTLALFFAPVVLFAAVAYMHQSSDRGTDRLAVTPIGALLAVLSAGYVILHAQHAVNLLLVFGAICGVQFVFRRYRPGHAIANHRPLYAPTVLLAGFILAWVATHETATRAARITFDSIFRGEIGAASEVAQRSGSLLAIGGGILELFAKLFLVSALFAVLAGGFLLLADIGSIDLEGELRGYMVYVTAALVPLTLLFAVYFLGTPKMAFRQFGFVFVLLTAVGGVAVAWVTGVLESEIGIGRTAVAVVLVACLVISLLTVFPSPFIYKSTPTVTEATVSGYETTFDQRAADVPVATLNSRPSRYADAIYGTVESASMDVSGAGEGALNASGVDRGDPAAAYPADSYYFALTAADVQTELVVYEQLNYERAGLRTMKSSPRTERVFSNGEYRLYLVSNETGT